MRAFPGNFTTKKTQTSVCILMALPRRSLGPGLGPGPGLGWAGPWAELRPPIAAVNYTVARLCTHASACADAPQTYRSCSEWRMGTCAHEKGGHSEVDIESKASALLLICHTGHNTCLLVLPDALLEEVCLAL